MVATKLEALKLKIKVWQLLILTGLLLGVIVAANVMVTSYLNRSLSDQVAQCHTDSQDLKTFTGETLGQLTVMRAQLQSEVDKRQLAEKLLIDKGMTPDVLQRYEKDKLAVIVSTNSGTTDELCTRAKRFGIECDTTK